MSNWKEMILSAMSDRGETLDDVVSSTMSDEQMLVEFDAGFGEEEGIPFTVWTFNYVYFPCSYDGAEWVGSVSRHPDGKPTRHQG